MLSATDRPDVAIRSWSEGDLPLLERLLGDPIMMKLLGGPETPEAIRARHARYLGSDVSSGALYAIAVGPEWTPVGWLGYWQTSWRGRDVWECGWHVLLEYQARGLASSAARLMIERARARRTLRFMHAFPAVENAASHALCRRLGFRSLGEVDVEYPIGHTMRSIDWCLDLFDEDAALVR